MPALYDLFWDSGPAHARTAQVARAKQGATIVLGARTPAVILYPSFFTPALFFPDDAELKGHFELLMATPGTELTPALVNTQLVITKGLAQQRRRPSGARALFDAAAGRIVVEPTEPDSHGILATHTQFRGILHRTWRDHLVADDWSRIRYWKVRVHAAACERAQPSPTRGGDFMVQDPQDDAIARLFAVRNDLLFLRTDGFRVRDGDVLPESPDAERPILAHHPLAVYPAKARALSRVLHVSDLHLNLRQDLLAQTDARVIEAPASALGAGDGAEISPEIGALVQRYSRNVLSILEGAAARSTPDAICVGGDLVDHIRNATLRTDKPIPGSAAAVWECVGLETASYRQRYTAGPDFIAAFSIMRYVCEKYAVPLFGVTGNHDAYVDGFGVSPRVVNTRVKRKLANEGIAADHNLTFFEAILAFGPTYHAYDGYGNVRSGLETAKAGTSNFHREWFDWFHTVFTPFADFAVSMPAQRLVGLGWGDSEHMIGGLGDGHGMGHLPRADGTVGDAQLELVRKDLSTERRTLLMTHFTFASFKSSVAETVLPAQGARRGPGDPAREPTRGQLLFDGPFTDFDHGTFTGKRAEMFAALTDDPAKISAVLTGHSHRKALYLLPKGAGRIAQRDAMSASGTWTAAGDVAAASVPPPDGPTVTMVGLGSGRLAGRTLAPLVQDAVPVILSDSAGPIPRANLHDEFGRWGSDRAAGTVIEFDWKGQLQGITVVPSSASRAPRVAVALDYWHTYGEDGDGREVWDGAVMEFGTVTRRGLGEPPPTPLAFWMPLKARWEAIGLAVREVVLVRRLDAGAGAAGAPRWVSIRARPRGDELPDPARPRIGRRGAGFRTFPMWELPAAQERDLKDWFAMGPASDRFLALRFTADFAKEPWMRERYDWDSWWTFEVVTQVVADLGRYAPRWRVRTTADAWELSLASSPSELSADRPVAEQPDFARRRAVYPDKYATSVSADSRRVR